MLSKIFFFNCLSFILLVSHSQIVFEQEKTYSQIFSYELSKDSVSQLIISQIAKAQTKSINTTNVHIAYRLYKQIKQLDSLKYQIFVELQKPIIYGDIYYRDINIQNVLIPDRISFNCLTSCNNEDIIHIANTEIPLTGNMGYYQIIKKNIVFAKICSNISINCDQPILSWSENVLKQFIQTAELINEYFSIDKVLNDLEAQLKNIDLAKIDKYPFYNVIIDEINKHIEHLNSKQFNERLQLWNSDPIDYMSRLKNLQDQIISIKSFLKKQLEHFDKVLFEKAMSCKNNNIQDSVSFYLNKSISFNPVFSPSLTEQAIILANNDQIDSALTILQYVLQFTYIPIYYQQQFRDYVPFWISITNEKISQLISQQDYNHAEKILQRILEICKNELFSSYFAHFEQYMARVKYGLYASILEIVKSALNFQRVQLAYEYTQRAINYQKQNYQYIISSIEARKFYKDIVTQTIKLIDQHRSKKKYEQSLQLIEWLQNICDTMQPFCNENLLDSLLVLNATDFFTKRLDEIAENIENKEFSIAKTRLVLLEEYLKQYPFLSKNQQYLNLEKRINEYFFQQELSLALQNIQHGFWLHAWNALLQAKKTQQNYNIPGKQVDSLVQSIAQNVIFEFFKQLAKDSILVDSEILYSRIIKFEQEIATFKLTLNDNDITQLLQFKYYTKDRICKKITPYYERFFKEIDAIIYKHEFDVAYQNLLAKRAKFENFDFCHIIKQKFNDYEFRLNEALNYVHQKNLLKGFILSSDWANALSQLEIINNIAASQPFLSVWKIKQLSEIELIKQIQNIDFALFAFEVLLERKKYDECFQIIDFLRRKEYSAKLTKKHQEQLGTKMAVRDKLKNPNANYKINILYYTEGDEYFSYFSKTYRKTWKKHKI